jgi:CRISPR system Cascade subunit CasE
MYLSRVSLDLHKRTTMIALANPQQFHGAVEQAFPGERRRRLWRLDPLGEKLYLMILSEDMPDLSGIEDQFGSGEPGETKSYDPLLERILPGSVWHFRLAANPTTSKMSSLGSLERGKVQAHITPEFQEKWLQTRAEKHGFSLKNLQVTGSRWLRFQKGHRGRPVTLLSVVYEGVLEVTDPDLFRQVLKEGIGRGKAYGQGLLTVMKGGTNHG